MRGALAAVRLLAPQASSFAAPRVGALGVAPTHWLTYSPRYSYTNMQINNNRAFPPPNPDVSLMAGLVGILSMGLVGDGCAAQCAEDDTKNGTKRKATQPLDNIKMERVTIPTSDILLGTGITGNPGNSYFQRVVDSKMAEYRLLGDKQKKEKGSLAMGIVNQMRGEKHRFLKQDKNTKLWYEADDSFIRKKVTNKLSSKREISPSPIMAMPVSARPIWERKRFGQMKSWIDINFLEENRDLLPSVKEICRDLYCNPSHHPSIPGKGMCLSADSPAGSTTETINLLRTSYVPQYFGENMLDKETNNPNTVYRYAYGTGSGETSGKAGSLGVPPR